MAGAWYALIDDELAKRRAANERNIEWWHRFRDLVQAVYSPDWIERDMRYFLAGDVWQMAKRRGVTYHEELQRAQFICEMVAIGIYERRAGGGE